MSAFDANAWQTDMNDALEKLRQSQGQAGSQTSNPPGSYKQWSDKAQIKPGIASSATLDESAAKYPTMNYGGAPQGGTNARPGHAIGGIMGSPNLGTVSSLQSWVKAIDAMYGPGAGEKYLQMRGINPTVNGQSAFTPQNAGNNALSMGATGNQAASAANQQEWAAGADARAAMTHELQPAYTDRLGRQHAAIIGDNNGVALNGGGYRNGVAEPQSNVHDYNPSAGIAGGGGSSSGLGGQIEAAYSRMLQNPTGYTPIQEQMLRNRATEPIANQQNENLTATREDAIRRGAASSDADIRDQLNRVSAQGAKDQGDASFNVDKALADLKRSGTLGAAAGGTSYIGTQNQYQLQLAQLQSQLAQQQAENGPLGGLKSVMGG